MEQLQSHLNAFENAAVRNRKKILAELLDCLEHLTAADAQIGRHAGAADIPYATPWC